jgi:DNA-binding transcriptional regulator YiaG
MAKTASKTESGVLDTVHKTAAGLHRAGVIGKATMREFDALCLTPVTPMAPEEIKALRKREQVSQRCSPATSTSAGMLSASGNAGRSARMARR